MGNEQSNPKKTSRCSLDRPPIEGRARSASGTPQVTVARIEEGENTPNLLEVSRRLSSCELTPTRLERRPSRGKVSLTGENPYLMGQSPSRRGSRAGHIEGVAKGVTTLMEQVKLSQYQCQLLRQTWAKLRSNHDVFTQVFKVLSYKSPTSREIFQKMSIVDGFKGHSHCDLNAHIRYLVELLDTLVGELHQPAKAAESKCVEIGVNHWGMSERSVSGIWEAMGESLAEVITRHDIVRQKREAVKAWICFISFLVDSMKSGYASEYRRRQTRPSAGNIEVPSHLIAAEDPS